MNRKTLSSSRLICWRNLRWAVALPALPAALWACASHPLNEPKPTPELQSNIYITVAPVRKLDMVFMVDNSPSMAPKQKKMTDQFPNLLNALRDKDTKQLPDLRVAIIDSDLGTDGGYTSGSCGPNAANGNSAYGDQGNFQMINAAACGVTDQSLWLFENDGANPPSVNFTGGDIGSVFGCLAKNLGTAGCGFEHQLQAFQWAFNVAGHEVTQKANFIRPDAFLGLVFLTDEDDCSGYRYNPNPVPNGMFNYQLPLTNESASLRCSTRAFQCNDRKDPNLTVTPPGYPTTAPFHDLYKNCQPRTDFCAADVDTSQPTSCNPLANYVDIANAIKGVKNDDTKLLVAGIFGYPKQNDLDTAPFIIDETPNPFYTPGSTSSVAQIYDYWPVCFDDAHVPPAGTYTADAAGWGATGGLRNSAFIDEFGKNGLKFSICESDFTNAMSAIGNAISIRLQNLCVNYKLIDTDLNTPGIQADCHVTDRVPNANGVGYTESSYSIPRCDQANGQLPCWELTQDNVKCPTDPNNPAIVAGQLINVQRAKGAVVAPGTIVNMQCRTCATGYTIPGC